MAFEDPFAIHPSGKHTHTIIFLHGRGSNGKEFFEDLLGNDHLNNRFSSASNCKWVFPSAHMRYDSTFKEELQAWYDVYSLTDPDAEWELQVDGLRESIEYISSIIEAEMKIVPPENIIFGGISQGFAVASHVLLTLSQALGGFAGLSGWIPFQADAHAIAHNGGHLWPLYLDKFGLKLDQMRLSSTRTPVFVSHSKNDDIAEHRLGVAACDTLRGLEFDVAFREYEDGGH
ncbi:MAG: hypothetical protein MMC23_001140 [Stictis urceolatum]|nr:hypothetical protein [Stictis urceolata]